MTRILACGVRREARMIEDRGVGIWRRFARAALWREPRPMDDAVGNVVRFDRIDVLAPLEGQGGGLYLADARDCAREHAAFSQHIGG